MRSFFLFIFINFFSSSYAQTPQEKDLTMESKAKSSKHTKDYVHRWTTFPPIEGETLENVKFLQKHERGQVDVLFFIASWCVPCQETLRYMKELESRYNKINTRFLYVFSHDRIKEAKQFSEKFNLKNVVVATHEILKNFHNPNLPGVYVSDRDGWLLERFIKANKDDFKKLDQTLHKLNAY